MRASDVVRMFETHQAEVVIPVSGVVIQAQVDMANDVVGAVLVILGLEVDDGHAGGTTRTASSLTTAEGGQASPVLSAPPSLPGGKPEPLGFPLPESAGAA
jgi:hypothetical protein